MSTSVARLIPSTNECRQPYLLSNFDLVTASLTLIAGNNNNPSRSISYNRCTPVVVSSVTPRIPLASWFHFDSSLASEFRSRSSTTFHSSGSSASAAGTAPACENSSQLWASVVGCAQ